MRTEFTILQFVWAMLDNTPVKAKVIEITINRNNTIDYRLEFQWERAGKPHYFTRYEKDLAHTKEELMDIVLSKAIGK